MIGDSWEKLQVYDLETLVKSELKDTNSSILKEVVLKIDANDLIKKHITEFKMHHERQWIQRYKAFFVVRSIVRKNELSSSLFYFL